MLSKPHGNVTMVQPLMYVVNGAHFPKAMISNLLSSNIFFYQKLQMVPVTVNLRSDDSSTLNFPPEPSFEIRYPRVKTFF
jgi:hypothetical protein